MFLNCIKILLTLKQSFSHVQTKKVSLKNDTMNFKKFILDLWVSDLEKSKSL
jgi:hypothetical protein